MAERLNLSGRISGGLSYAIPFFDSIAAALISNSILRAQASSQLLGLPPGALQKLVVFSLHLSDGCRREHKGGCQIHVLNSTSSLETMCYRQRSTSLARSVSV
jgi:hypothetical protein